MDGQAFVRASDIMRDLQVSKPFAYKILREMNAELNAMGFKAISGRVSRQFYEKKILWRPRNFTHS